MEGLQTPLFPVHQELGAKMIPFGGWIMPVQYSQILEEHEAVRTAAGLFDLSHMGEFYLRGPEAVADVERLVTNHVGKLTPGQALYTPMCRDDGTIVDDLLVYRLSANELLLVVNASTTDKDREWVTRHLAKSTHFEDQSSATAMVAIQGPKAAEVLAKQFPAARDLKPFHFTKAPFGGVEVFVARTGYTGEDGFEILVPNAQAAALWKALSGPAVKPIGLGARDTLRLEARLMLYGNDIDDTTTPMEAGIGWTVKLDKGEFIGRSVLLKQKDEGTARKLVGFKMTGRGIARHGHEIVQDGKAVGVVTSGTMSPTLKESIGLAYVPSGLSAVGTPLSIKIRDKDVAAVVVATPFYKRKK